MSYRVFTKPTSSSHSNSPLEDMSAFPTSLFLLPDDQYLRLHLNTAFLAKKQLNQFKGLLFIPYVDENLTQKNVFAILINELTKCVILYQNRVS